MAYSSAKLDEALRQLIEAYVQLEADSEKKHAGDEDVVSSAIIDAIAESLESAIEDQDISTGYFATVASALSEALEQLDPSAFEDPDSDDEKDDDDDIDIDDLDDDLDYEDLDEDEDDEDDD